MSGKDYDFTNDDCPKLVKTLEKILKYEFNDQDLLIQAMRHSSYVAEKKYVFIYYNKTFFYVIFKRKNFPVSPRIFSRGILCSFESSYEVLYLLWNNYPVTIYAITLSIKTHTRVSRTDKVICLAIGRKPLCCFKDGYPIIV